MTTSNPFPGMNPFMERRWHDVHLKMIAMICDGLGLGLPDTYTAVAEEHINVLGGEASSYVPDVAVIDEPWKRGQPPAWTPDADKQAAVPIIFRLEAPPERWVEVRHDDGQLVTVIEVISPSNREQGRGAFLAKRNDYIASAVNIVEIDLLRDGQRLIDVPRKEYASLIGNDEHYTVCTIRAGDAAGREIYKCPLRQPLPAIRVPLRHPDADIVLNLQPMIDSIYTNGRYWKLDYNLPLDPMLNADDQAWASGCLAAAGLV